MVITGTKSYVQIEDDEGNIARFSGETCLGGFYAYAEDVSWIRHANVKHFFTLLGKMFFTSYGKEFFIYHGKQIFTSQGKHLFTRYGKQTLSSAQPCG